MATKKGYTMIANELLEFIPKFHFTSRQRDVLDVLMRNTYGFHCEMCQLSIRDIGEKADMAFQHVSTTLQDLINMNVVKVEWKSKRIRMLGINSDYSQWTKCHQNGYCNQNSDYDSHQNGDEVVTRMVTHTIQRKIKERGKERSPVFLGLWEMYPEDKRYGLQFVSADVESDVVEHADAVKTAMEIYIAQTDPKYICKASRFFEEKWRLYYKPDESRKPMNGDDMQ